MKKIVGILVFTFLVSTTINAQEQKHKKTKKRVNFTAEQSATLQTKKMTLHLDLDKNQQKSIYDLKKKQAEERKNNIENLKKRNKEGVQLTSDDRFERQNNRLEKKLENKTAMKSILTTKQFEKWENTSKRENKAKKTRMKKKFNSVKAKKKNKQN